MSENLDYEDEEIDYARAYYEAYAATMREKGHTIKPFDNLSDAQEAAIIAGVKAVIKKVTEDSF